MKKSYSANRSHSWHSRTGKLPNPLMQVKWTRRRRSIATINPDSAIPKSSFLWWPEPLPLLIWINVGPLVLSALADGSW